ncbi:hypothetical protein GUJ93_ZPchr0008g11631 [Zizania palustris]|uniref:Uncharacterized protein n=1 Tax=Zizania palustris TaxID=103762 RepID=A0A8J5RIS3_ZIZPA|nr:hypothetical protein GUJ93_ZPchr0008g11631 [Zizania palustris]
MRPHSSSELWLQAAQIASLGGRAIWTSFCVRPVHRFGRRRRSPEPFLFFLDKAQNPLKDVRVRAPVTTARKGEACRPVRSQGFEDGPSVSKSIVKFEYFDIAIASMDTLNDPQKGTLY